MFNSVFCIYCSDSCKWYHGTCFKQKPKQILKSGKIFSIISTCRRQRNTVGSSESEDFLKASTVPSPLGSANVGWGLPQAHRDTHDWRLRPPPPFPPTPTPPPTATTTITKKREATLSIDRLAVEEEEHTQR